jgi:hypothetical protein
MLGIARWLFTLLGGLLLGAGLVLHGQVALARHMKNQVESTGWVWRALGEATFAFQSGDVRMAMAMQEVPDAALKQSDRAAWVVVIVGSLIALTGPLLRRGRPAPKKGAKKK